MEEEEEEGWGRNDEGTEVIQYVIIDTADDCVHIGVHSHAIVCQSIRERGMEKERERDGGREGERGKQREGTVALPIRRG